MSDHHAPNNFITKYIFSRDHKVIAKQFLFSSFIWLAIGGLLGLAVRWQLAYPETSFPIIGQMWFAKQGGVIPGEVYNTLFTMHGTIMIFLVIIPMLLGAFANFLIPLQIGYKDMAFPTLNMISYWIMWPGFIFFALSFFVEGGASGNGWTSYPTLSAGNVQDPVTNAGLTAPGAGPGQTCWLLGITFVGISSMMGSVNYMTTILNCRAKGMSLFRMPLSTWALFVTSFLQAFAVPVLTAGGIMLLVDRSLGTNFFMPDLVWINGYLYHRGDGQGAGTPLLWQHLFWFYSHPAVYIMILPTMGFVSEILATFSRKPVFGYKAMIFSMVTIAGLGFVVWGHHMFTSGMNEGLGLAFMITTIFIALPSAIKVFNWLGTMWGGRLQPTTPMLHAVGFVSLFIMGGLTGIILAVPPVDRNLHDTYFVVAHFHYVLAGSSLFGIFAGLTYWYPKMFGRMMSDFWGKVHFALTFIFFNATFLPMHWTGKMGMIRRVGDPYHYDYLENLIPINQFITMAAIGMGLTQLIFLFNFFGSMVFGKKAPSNPWHANGLEWQTPSPPPHGNFADDLVVYRGPHEYGSPAVPKSGFLPQWINPSDVETFDTDHEDPSYTKYQEELSQSENTDHA